MEYNEIVLSSDSEEDVDENISVNFLTREQAKVAGNSYLNYSSCYLESDYSNNSINDVCSESYTETLPHMEGWLERHTRNIAKPWVRRYFVLSRRVL
jgi:hypothetical protein